MQPIAADSMSDSFRPRLTTGVIAAALFTIAYLLTAAIAASVTGNGEFVFYISVMIVLILGVTAVHIRVGLTTSLLWLLTLWGAAHMGGGLVTVPESWPTDGGFRVLYSLWIVPRADGGGWLKYDQVVHAYGFGVTTWLCWQALCGALRGLGAGVIRPRIGLLVLVGAAACGFGAMNEVVEFIATRLTATNVGGYVNTSWDLVANLVGSVVAGVLIYVHGIAQRTTS